MESREEMRDLSYEKALKEALGKDGQGLDVRVFSELDSTNRYAKALAMEGKTAHALICAHAQSAGRGRLGRSFYSPRESGVYFSILYPMKGDPAQMVPVTSCAAVAVMRAVLSLTGKQTAIKWVNDLYLDGKKVCGILAESVLMGEGRAYLVLGIGINWRTAEFPLELAEIAGSVGADEIPGSALISHIYRELCPFLRDPSDRAWLEDYRAHSLVLDKEITWMQDGLLRQGHALEIDANGGLVVQDESGALQTLCTGEITVRLLSGAT